MASNAATDEGVEEESCGCGLLTSLQVWSPDMDSLLFLRSPFLVLVGITTGLVVDWGVRIFGGMSDFTALSFLEIPSATETGICFFSFCFVEVLDVGEL